MIDVVVANAPTLIRFTVCHDGARMACHYCGADALLGEREIDSQILLFQEAHFGCDPDLAAARLY